MSKTILTAEEINKILERLSYQVLESIKKPNQLALIGIQRRGVDLAYYIHNFLTQKLNVNIPFGDLDINLYRDDWTCLSHVPYINTSNIPFSLDNKEVILIDDVIFTGRTIRAALDALMDYGRPTSIKLLVLIDRGHRELPIHPDFVGKKINTSLSEKVHVFTLAQDGKSQVILEEPENSKPTT